MSEIRTGQQTSPTRVEGWPQWRGPARDGVASAFTAPTTWPAQLTKKWQATVGARTRLAGDRRQSRRRAHAAGQSRDRRGLRSRVGQTAVAGRRRCAVHDELGGDRSRARDRSRRRSIADGRVFTLGISGIFSAHDLATGKLLWRKNAPPAPPEFGTATSPMVDGANVIAFLGGTGAGALTAMDAATGAVKWRWTGDGPGYTSPIIATIGGTRQIITQSQNQAGRRRGGRRTSCCGKCRSRRRTNRTRSRRSSSATCVIYAGLENPTIALRDHRGLGQGMDGDAARGATSRCRCI